MATMSDAAAKRRRINKACYYCNRSHLQCDSERPCERCKSRNIGHMCRDEDDDLHVMMQRYRDTMATFNQTIREKRAASGQPAPTPPTFPGHPVDSKDQSDMRYFSLLDAMQGQSVDLIGPSAGRLFTADTAGHAESFESILQHQDDAQIMRLYRFLHKQCEQANPDADPADVRYTVNTLTTFYSHVLGATEALSAKVSAAELEYIRQHAFTLRETFLQLVYKLNYRELVETQQMYERHVMSLRKFFSALGLPGCCWRRGMQLSLVSEQFAEILGYLPNELMMSHVFQYIHDPDVFPFIRDVLIPILSPNMPSSQIYTLNLVRKDKRIVTVRAAVCAMKTSQKVPVGIVMTMAPLQPIHTSVLTPEMEVSPTAFTRESALEAISSGISLLASINPGVGVTLEDMAGLFSWF